MTEIHKEPKPISKYQGTVGQVISPIVTVDAVHVFDSYTPNKKSYFYIMRDEDGNIFIWRTTTTIMDQGQTYLINGKIKAHNEFRGKKQTVLTRCRVGCHRCRSDKRTLWIYRNGTKVCESCWYLDHPEDLPEVENEI